MRKVLLSVLTILLFGVAVLSSAARAQNSELTADELAQLGVTAEQVNKLQVISEKVSKNKDAIPGLSATKVLFGNGGGNRFIWRVDFEDKVPENSNIIFYLNTDNDENTGRENYKGGIDLMVFATNGFPRTTAYKADGTLVTGPEASTLLKDNHLYMTVDVDLQQENDQSAAGLYVLVQSNVPLKGQSSFPLFQFRGAPISQTPKIDREAMKFTSTDVVYTWGLHDLRRYQEDKNNIWIPVTDAKLSGWNIQYSSYRENSAIISRGQGSIKIEAPRDGQFYPSFILYEQTIDSAINILVNGKKLGLAVTKDGDNNQKLFALDKPVNLKKGDVVELRNLNNNGNFRIEGILLLKNLFPQKDNQYSYKYISATRPWQNPNAMRITFTSTWPVQTKVLFGTTEKLGNTIEEQTTVPTNNHRIYLSDLQEGQKYFYRISGIDRDGKESLSPLQSFVFQKPKYPAAIAQTQTVPLKLSQIPQGLWSVNSGVPFAEGQVFETKNIRLLSASNQPIAAQKKVLARWHDGSIRWALVSFNANADQDKYQVQFGAKINDSDTKTIAEKSADGISVNTGALQWRAKKNAAGAYEIALSRGGKVLLDAAQINIRDQDGKKYSSNFMPDEIKIEENGAQRAVILMRGKLGNPDKSTFFRYEVRWTFAQNLPLANVRVTLLNDQVKSTFSHVQSADLQFKLPASDGEITLPEIGKSAAPINVAQTFDDKYTAQISGAEKSGKRFPGWMNWQNDDHQLSLAVRNFWQLYPKALDVKNDTLTIGMAPPVTAEEYARFKGTVEEYRSVFYLMDGQYKLRSGVAFTTEIALNLGAANGENVNNYVNHQPILIASPEYYRDAKVFGDIGIGSDFQLVKDYNEKTASSFDNYLEEREKQREYGLMNFGDWWGERKINWGNVEYDTMHAFILEFARSGNVDYLRAAQDAEIHNRDIDTVHYSANPPGKYFSIGGVSYNGNQAAPGLAYEHSVGHTGGYFDRNPVTGKEGTTYAADGMLHAVFSSSHTWTEGHYEYYLLTGDTRSLDVANSTSDFFGAYGTINYDFTNTRTPGWALIFTMGAYDATDDPFYLNAAHIIIDRVLERQTPDGGWDRQLGGGHCRHTPPHHGNAGFMVGVLMTGIKNYAESTGEQRAKDSIVKAAHFMIDDMWIPTANAFRYTSCPSTNPSPGLNLLIGEGIAYAWRQTREPELRRVMLDAMQMTISRMDGKGKNISMELRSTPPQLFDVIEMLKIKDPITATAQAKVPTAGEGGKVLFSAQSKTEDASAVTYSWDFGDGKTGVGQNISHEYPNGGDYVVTLTAKNAKGDIATYPLRINVMPPAMQNIDLTETTLIEAEDFTEQGGGSGNDIGIVSDRVGASGKAITKWEQNIGRWAKWDFEIPQDGEYQITLKYASGSPQAERSVTIDGKIPDAALEKVLLPGTGGFSQGTDDWKYWTLLGGDQKPLKFSLSKGKHTLQITNIKGGLALDYILVQKQ